VNFYIDKINKLIDVTLSARSGLKTFRYRPTDLHRKNVVVLLQAFAGKPVGIGITCTICYVLRYSNTIEENSSIFSLIRMH